MKKRNGFTLIEMLITVALIGIFMGIGFDFLQNITIKANNTFNRKSDLQNGVEITIDKISSMLKSSTQIHIVGDDVYRIGQSDYSGIDDRFSYIIKYKDDLGNITLANMIPTGRTDPKFDIFPILASNTNDNMGRINYKLSLYDNEKNYSDKMLEKVLNMKVVGEYLDSNGNKIDEFVLKKDISVSNTNQIMISQFLKGGINDFTAIAYDSKPITATTSVKNQKLAIVFVLDNSGSMKFTTNYFCLRPYRGTMYYTIHGVNDYKENNEDVYNDDEQVNPSTMPLTKNNWGSWVCVADANNQRHGFPILGPTNRPYKAEEDANKHQKFLDKMNDPFLAPRNVIVGNTMTGSMMNTLNNLMNNGVEVQAYAFNFHGSTTYGFNKAKTSGEYFFPIDDLKNSGYGPYILNDSNIRNNFNARITNTLQMSYQGESLTEFIGDSGKKMYFPAGSTNTGAALLQALELLKQIKNVDNKFLIFLSDGVPTTYNESIIKPNGNIPTFVKSFNKKMAMNYVEFVTRPGNNLNIQSTYSKAYLIGFSGLKADKSEMRQIREYLARSGSEVNYFDAYDKNNLEKSFNSIIQDISESLTVFDGPKKSTTK